MNSEESDIAALLKSDEFHPPSKKPRLAATCSSEGDSAEMINIKKLLRNAQAENASLRREVIAVRTELNKVKKEARGKAYLESMEKEVKGKTHLESLEDCLLNEEPTGESGKNPSVELTELCVKSGFGQPSFKVSPASHFVCNLTVGNKNKKLFQTSAPGFNKAAARRQAASKMLIEIRTYQANSAETTRKQ